ncbi:VWA domain-containing protein [Mangrovicoccus sp. HB161399]|uniref:VWA domain-containing protein n=1 Tax=Mangrovicoccus sp. HB161399 TaxID=2720392 RepID=UPI001551B762|nr:VWA domain-containing protein [Mangrovicoccus sp. HB161399]
MRATRFPARASGPAERLSGFLAHLRMNGLAPCPLPEALAALAAVKAADPAEARLALKVAAAGDAEAWERFDDLFDAFWFNAGMTRTGTQSAHVQVQTARPRLWQGHLDEGDGHESGGQPEADDGGGEAEGAEGRLIATRRDSLMRRDLRELMDEATRREAERTAEAIARAIRDRRSRRRRQALRGALPDLRRTIRASLARGGEPIDLFRRARPDRPARIVALCDVSGSMQPYARPFLAFLKGLADADTATDAYLFHTRLIRVTAALRDRDRLRAAGRLSLMAQGFGGGTDIGAALEAFAGTCGAKALTRRSAVLILSDGYCTGAPERLAAALARIRRRAGRIIWLNPLLGWQGYAPVAAAMAAALPHLDAHLPANTLAALAALEPDLARL